MLSQHSLLNGKVRNGRINVVFDIDGVLAFHSSQLSDNCISIFEKYSAVITAAGHVHYVSIGAIELLKLLFSLSYIRVSFFSSGAKLRNTELVEKLLILALGEVNYQSIKSEVVVLSREDRTYYGHGSHSDELSKLCSCLTGEFKKDLTKILRPEDSIAEAILIDDDPSFVCLGQHNNILVCPETGGSCYYSLEEGRCYFSGSYDDCNFRGINNIFYVTGILIKLITEHRAGGKSITDTLFDINFITHEEYRKEVLLKYARSEYIGEPIPEYNPPKLESCWLKSMSQIQHYESGLKILTEYNPDLAIINNEFYDDQFSHQPTSSVIP